MRHASTKLTIGADRIATAIFGNAYLAPATPGAAVLPSRRDRKPASCTGGVAQG